MSGLSVAEAKALLESSGYVVVKATSYRAAQQRQAIHAMRVEWAERAAEHARTWAENCLGEERRLRDRCTFLYGLAVSHGATLQELAGEVERVAAADAKDRPS